MPVALLTDFGNSDHYVGALKAAILTVSPRSTIVDITHEITPFDIREAAYVLASCFPYFPAGTIFVCVVDPGVGSSRRGIAARLSDRYYVGPDNGLISLIAKEGNIEAVELTDDRYFLGEVSDTFHGRDIFAPVAGHLSNGVAIDNFGTGVKTLERLGFGKPVEVSRGRFEGSVLHIDRFGNIVTDLGSELISGSCRLTLNGRSVTSVARVYAGASDGMPFMIAGSTGLIEISLNRASAAEMLSARTGQTITFETDIE